MPSHAPANWYPRRREVYLVDLDKPRPAVILSVDALNKFALDVCLLPITTVPHVRFSLRVPLKAGEGGLDDDSWAECDQVTTLEKHFLRYPPLGVLSEAVFRMIQEQVKVALGL
jgi:mRNA interferase MazF